MSHKYVYVPFIRKPVIPSSIIIMMVETRSYCETAHVQQRCSYNNYQWVREAVSGWVSEAMNECAGACD